MKKSINYNAMLYSKSNLPFFRFTITFKHELYEHVYKLGRRHICLDTEIRKHSFSKLLNLLFSTTFQPHLGIFKVLCFRQRWEVYMKCVLVKIKESVALTKNVSVYENWNFVGNTHREITDLTHFLKLLLVLTQYFTFWMIS